MDDVATQPSSHDAWRIEGWIAGQPSIAGAVAAALLGEQTVDDELLFARGLPCDKEAVREANAPALVVKAIGDFPKTEDLLELAFNVLVEMLRGDAKCKQAVKEAAKQRAAGSRAARSGPALAQRVQVRRTRTFLFEARFGPLHLFFRDSACAPSERRMSTGPTTKLNQRQPIPSPFQATSICEQAGSNGEQA